MKLLRKKMTLFIMSVIFCIAVFTQNTIAIQNTDSTAQSINILRTPLTDQIKMQGFDLKEGVNGNINMPTGVGLPATQPSFFSNVYDGNSIWLLPSSSDKLVKISPDTGSMEGFSLAEGVNGNSNMGNAPTKTGRFAGGVVVGDEIWLAPYSIDRLIKINITTGAMTGFSFIDGINGNVNVGALGTVGAKFSGVVYDGTNIWLIPASSSKLVRVDPQTGSMTGLNLTEGTNGNTNMPTGANLFNGGLYDGTYIWMIPFNASKVVRLHPATGTMVGYDMTEGVNSNINMGNLGNIPLLATCRFYGGSFDGKNIWMVPGSGNRVVRLSPTTGTMTGFDMAEGVNGNTNMGDCAITNYRFSQGNYDGRNIWMFPSYSNRLVKLDPQTGTMTGYEVEEGVFGDTGNINMGDVATTALSKFYGGCFDGKNLWATPWRSNRVVKISSTVDLTLYGAPENNTESYEPVNITAEVDLFGGEFVVDEIKYIQNGDQVTLSENAFSSHYNTVDDSEKGDFTNTEESDSSLARYTFYASENATYHVFLRAYDPANGQIVELTDSITVSNIVTPAAVYGRGVEEGSRNIDYVLEITENVEPIAQAIPEENEPLEELEENEIPFGGGDGENQEEPGAHWLPLWFFLVASFVVLFLFFLSRHRKKI